MKKLLLCVIILLTVVIWASADTPPYRGYATLELGHAQFLIELGDQDVVYLPLDDLGRVQGVSAIISKSNDLRSVITDIRPTGWQQTSYPFIPGLNLYNRCHLLAHQFGGSDSIENIFTQTSHTHPAPNAKRSNALMQEKY